MATNYTTKTAALKATIADIRKVNAKSVDADEIKVKTGVDDKGNKTYSDVKTLIEEAATAATEAAGILIGDANSLVDVGTDNTDGVVTGGIGKMKNINFRGAYVNVVQKGDGTIDLWINPDNNLGKIAQGTTSDSITTASKVVYESSTDAWTMPVTAGETYDKCHLNSDDITITIQGKKGETVVDNFSIGNLTTKLRAVVYDKSGGVIGTCTTGFIGDDAATITQNGITINLGDIKVYTEDDAANGFVPNTVSLTATVKVDVSAAVGAGVWSLKVFADSYASKEATTCTTTQLWADGTQYFAYAAATPVISAAPTISEGTLVYRYVSGQAYVAAKSTFNVTYGSVTNATNCVGTDVAKRGTISLTQCGSTTIVGGKNTDNEKTTVAGGTVTMTLTDSKKTIVSSLTATHYADGQTADVVNMKSAVYNSKPIWPAGTTDSHNTAYFEREDGNYGRILGHIDNGTLVIDNATFDSKQALSGNTANPAYNNQAKVYNGTLVYGSGSGNKYYVRKFLLDANDASQCSSYKITIPGISRLGGTAMEAWMYLTDDLTNGRRIDLDTATPASNGQFGVGKSISGNTITVENKHIYMHDTPFYVVIKLNETGASVTSDVSVAKNA